MYNDKMGFKINFWEKRIYQMSQSQSLFQDIIWAQVNLNSNRKIGRVGCLLEKDQNLVIAKQERPAKYTEQAEGK